MNKANIAKIKLQCPILCRQGQPSILNCGDGWFRMVEKMMLELEAIVTSYKKEGWKPEKLPGLFHIETNRGQIKVDIDYSTHDMDQVIELYEDMSETVCETCGQPGSLNGNGWIEVMCEKCAQEAGR